LKSDPFIVSNKGCKDLLQEMKKEGRKHWEIMGIMLSLSNHEEMEYLFYGLDLVFMRPEFIILEFKVFFDRSDQEHLTECLNRIDRIYRYLKRIGYMSNHNAVREFVEKSTDSKSQISYYIWGIRMNMFEI
jgi:hypothetical protein